MVRRDTTTPHALAHECEQETEIDYYGLQELFQNDDEGLYEVEDVLITDFDGTPWSQAYLSIPKYGFQSKNASCWKPTEEYLAICPVCPITRGLAQRVDRLFILDNERGPGNSGAVTDHTPKPPLSTQPTASDASNRKRKASDMSDLTDFRPATRLKTHDPWYLPVIVVNALFFQMGLFVLTVSLRLMMTPWLNCSES